MVISELFCKLGLKVDEGSFSRADAMIGGLKKGLVAIGVTLAAGAVIRGLQHLVDETANAAGAAGRAAQRVGVAREALEELNHAASESEVPIETLEGGLKFLSRNLYETTQGNHQLAAAFRGLGVRTTDAGGKLRSADEVLMDLSERFAAMPDGPRKTALAMQLFGRAGNELIPMLNKGSQVLGEYRQEAHELGLVFSEEAAAAAKEYRKATSDLNDVVVGLKRQIGTGLLVEIAKLKKGFAEWLAQNRELIRQRVTALAMGLATALKYTAQMLEPVVRFLALLASNARVATATVATLGFIFNASLMAPLAALGLILMAIEELWGWITGKRATLLEDWFGKFDDLSKNNPFVLMVEGWIQALEHFTEVVEEVKGALGFGSGGKGSRQMAIDQGAMQKGFAAAEATGMHSQWELAKSPRFTELARAKDWETIKQEFGPGTAFALREQAAAPPMATAAGAAGGASLSSAVTVNLTVSPDSASDPDDLGKRIGQAVNKEVAGLISDAYSGLVW